MKTCEVCGHKYRQMPQHLKVQCKVNQGHDELRRLAAGASTRGIVPAGNGAALIASLADNTKALIKHERVYSSVDQNGALFQTNSWALPWAVEIAKMTHIEPVIRRWIIANAARDEVFQSVVEHEWIPAYWTTVRLADHKKAAKLIKAWYQSGGRV